MNRPASALTLGAAAVLLAGCGASASTAGARPSPPRGAAASVAGRTTMAPWDRPVDQASRVAAAGLTLATHETLTVHFHVHLDVIADGVPVPVPADLGIVEVDARGFVLGTGTKGTAGMAALHTHEADGVLHVEAPAGETFTLGEAFAEWDVALGPGQLGGYRDGTAGYRVAAWVNGRLVTASPAQVVLSPHDEIAVVAYRGSPPAVPDRYTFAPGE